MPEEAEEEQGAAVVVAEGLEAQALPWERAELRRSMPATFPDLPAAKPARPADLKQIQPSDRTSKMRPSIGLKPTT